MAYRYNPLGIPRNILDAAEKAGLSYPSWYIGRREDPNYKRKKTLQDIVREVEEEQKSSEAADG